MPVGAPDVTTIDSRNGGTLMRIRSIAAVVLLLASSISGRAQPASASAPHGLTKVKDIVVYRDDSFYCSFPSILRRPDGELLVAFRRAPDRRVYGNASVTHTHPRS